MPQGPKLLRYHSRLISKSDPCHVNASHDEISCQLRGVYRNSPASFGGTDIGGAVCIAKLRRLPEGP